MNENRGRIGGAGGVAGAWRPLETTEVISAGQRHGVRSHAHSLRSTVDASIIERFVVAR